MPTYRLTLEYEGTRYSGWQAQGNTQKTVQGHLLRAARDVLGEVDIGGAGRTDAGVHASGQVAHLRTRKPLEPLQLARKLNDLLPHDINILEAVRAREAQDAGQGDGDEAVEGDRDKLFREAAEVVIQHQGGSTSLLQRRLKIGYGRAARIIDQLHTAGVLGPPDGSKPRDVLMGLEDLERIAGPKG